MHAHIYLVFTFYYWYTSLLLLWTPQHLRLRSQCSPGNKPEKLCVAYGCRTNSELTKTPNLGACHNRYVAEYLHDALPLVRNRINHIDRYTLGGVLVGGISLTLLQLVFQLNIQSLVQVFAFQPINTRKVAFVWCIQKWGGWLDYYVLLLLCICIIMYLPADWKSKASPIYTL